MRRDVPLILFSIPQKVLSPHSAVVAVGDVGRRVHDLGVDFNPAQFRPFPLIVNHRFKIENGRSLASCRQRLVRREVGVLRYNIPARHNVRVGKILRVAGFRLDGLAEGLALQQKSIVIGQRQPHSSNHAGACTSVVNRHRDAEDDPVGGHRATECRYRINPKRALPGLEPVERNDRKK